MGATMAAAGIDFDIAPVVDANVNPNNPAIGAIGRRFSSDPGVVAAMAEAEIKGLHERGSCPRSSTSRGWAAPRRTPTSTAST